MASTRQTVSVGWDSTGRITASGATATLITNNCGQTVFFYVTADDTTPTVDMALGHRVKNGGQHGLDLADTERLWLAVPTGTAQTITLFTGTA